MNPAPAVIDVQGLTKRFGRRTVVDQVSLKVRQGEIYGFLGPNGSGKTTTIRMLCGLLKPDGGSGSCLGHDLVSQGQEIKLKVGYMAQRFSLYEDLTVRENLRFVASLYQIPQVRRSVKELMERLGLDQYAGHLAGQLSGGWKQRLALGACLVHSPRLLLLDEPTAGVDPKSRRDFWELVHQAASQGVTALISTHYMDEAERCNRLAYIAWGQLLTSGTVEEVVDGEGLTTFALSGPDLHQLGTELRQAPGVDQVVALGNRLHVSGRDRDALERAIKSRLGLDQKCALVETSLEEVFISLMSRLGGE